MGTNILVAGLSIQVACLFAFSACSLEFFWRVRKNPELHNPEFTDLVQSKRFKLFLFGMRPKHNLLFHPRLTTWTALFGATTCLFVRTVFRSVELSEGFAGKLANQEIEFMILHGVMVILACISLTIWHPGYGIGQLWNEAGFRFRTSKTKDQEEAPHTISSGDIDKY